MRMFKRAAVAAMNKLSGSLTAPVASIGHFSLYMSFSGGSGLITVPTYQAPSAWVAGEPEGPLTLGPAFVGDGKLVNLGKIYIPCTEARYAAVKTAVMAQSLYGVYNFDNVLVLPNTSGINNGIGLGGYLRYTWTGASTHMVSVHWIQL